MSDRHIAYTVMLTSEIKDEYSEHIMDAIRMIKGVESVEPVISNVEYECAVRKAKRELREAIFESLE